MSSNVVRLPTRHGLLSKKQLAAELGRSPRWIELRMREGLPVEPRKTPAESTRFDLEKVTAWLDARADEKPRTLEQRVAQLEARVATLAAAVDRRAS